MDYPLGFSDFYRFIVPGGGTGGITVNIGEQLQHTNAEVVYLDFSMASMNISKQRARVRRLENIIWIKSWIENVKYLGLGSFNDLQCSGVLHHLKNPVYGLNILKEQLTKDGGMSLMVYGKFGRTGVYPIQKLMKLINSNQHDIKKEINNTNLILKTLPEKNWFVVKATGRNLNINVYRSWDILEDVGLYDLFLHKRDVAYSIKSLFQWLETNGLHFVDFDSTKSKFELKIRHQRYFDQYMKKALSNLNLSHQLHITEILKGNIITHAFYASKMENAEADLFDPLSMLYIHGNPIDFRPAVSNKKNIEYIGDKTIFRTAVTLINLHREQLHSKDIYIKKPGNEIVDFTFESNNVSHLLVDRLSFSNRGVSIRNLVLEYRKTVNSSVAANVVRRIRYFYDSVKDTEMFLIRKRHVNPFPMSCFKSYFQISSY